MEKNGVYVGPDSKWMGDAISQWEAGGEQLDSHCY
jgi:hypothetical protein